MTKTNAFETAQLDLRMGGRAINSVVLNQITPPEYLIIKSIHGDSAVRIIALQGPDIEQRLDEQGRLLQRVRPIASLTEKLISKYTAAVFKKVFPGVNPVLPFTFEAAGAFAQEADTDVADGNDGWEVIPSALDVEPSPKDRAMSELRKPVSNKPVSDLV